MIAAARRVNPLKGAAQAWDCFWFKPSDPSILGLIRLCCGLLTLYVHVAYTFDLQEFFGRDAWVDLRAVNQFREQTAWPAPPAEFDQPMAREPAARGYVAWSIWYSVTDPKAMIIIHALVLVAMLCFALGFCTRVTSVLTWLAAISYIQRSPMTLFGMDTMMNILLIYLMIGPSGAAWSVDALLAKRRAGATSEPVRLASANFALRLIQINLCAIYLVAGLSKLMGLTWWRGTAIWLTLANPEFSPLHLASYMSFLRWLCGHRLLWEVLLSGAVIFTFVVEIGFPFLVWNPKTRWVMVACAFAMHAGIALSMGLTTFSLMMIFMVMSFLPPELFRLETAAAFFRPAKDIAAPLPTEAKPLVRWNEPGQTLAG